MNEYSHTDFVKYEDWCFVEKYGWEWIWYSDVEVISKDFWFIQWLVQENKIDFELDSIIHKHKWIDYNTWKWIVVEKLCNRYETLLMLLAISKNPIDFLCEIIKN